MSTKSGKPHPHHVPQLRSYSNRTRITKPYLITAIRPPRASLAPFHPSPNTPVPPKTWVPPPSTRQVYGLFFLSVYVTSYYPWMANLETLSLLITERVPVP